MIMPSWACFPQILGDFSKGDTEPWGSHMYLQKSVSTGGRKERGFGYSTGLLISVLPEQIKPPREDPHGTWELEEAERSFGSGKVNRFRLWWILPPVYQSWLLGAWGWERFWGCIIGKESVYRWTCQCPGRGSVGTDIDARCFPPPVLIWLLTKWNNCTSSGQCNLHTGCPNLQPIFPADNSDIRNFPWNYNSLSFLLLPTDPFISHPKRWCLHSRKAGPISFEAIKSKVIEHVSKISFNFLD